MLNINSAPGSVLTSETADTAVPLQFMAGGEVVAWRVNQDYLTGKYIENPLQYSGTFVLVKSTCTPDPEKKDNNLDFYSLYIGLAPLSAFPKHKLYQVTEKGDGLRKREFTGKEKADDMAPVAEKHQLKTGDSVIVLRENTFDLKGQKQTFGLARALNSKSEMAGNAFWVSLDPQYVTPVGEQMGHLPVWMQQAVAQGVFDSVVKPETRLEVAAGDAVGYLAEDISPAGMGQVNKRPFAHIEVLSTDNRMSDFLNNKAQVKSGPKYIHIHPESYLYARSGDTFAKTKGQVKKDIHKIMPQDKCHPFTDSSGKRWFDIGDGAWLSEADVDADIGQYDLTKLGYSAFEEPPTSNMARSLYEAWAKSAMDLFAETVCPERGIREKQVSDYYKAILRKMDLDGDGELTGKELYQALHFPEMDVRDMAARLVVRHDSEWYGGSVHSRWQKILQNYDRLRINYAKQWLDDMEWMSHVDGFSSGEPVWHMHPVIFLNALSDAEEMITYEQLKAMLPADKENYVQIYLEPLNETMKIFEINTPLRKAHFMAQILHETGFFKYTEEIASGNAYEGRSDLGNNQAGDGPLFKGRGLLQITGRDNYTKCQQYLRTKLNDNSFDITSTTSKASYLSNNPRYAALASGYFWRYIKPKLNSSADKDDIYWVSVYVNGWAVQKKPYYPDKAKEPNHMDDRVAKLSIAKNAFGLE